jgi:ribosomal protein S27E
MVPNPHDDNRSIENQTQTTPSDQSETTDNPTVVEARAPGGLGGCSDCGRKSAIYHLESGEAVCGYCFGVRQGYIQQSEEIERDLRRMPINDAEIQQLDGLRLGDEQSVVRCHVCGDVIRAGSHLFAFASRSADEEMYGIENVWCTRDWDTAPVEFHKGERELVVLGRHGTRSNPATNEQWPVLLGPEVTRFSHVADAFETLSDEQ